MSSTAVGISEVVTRINNFAPVNLAMALFFNCSNAAALILCFFSLMTSMYVTPFLC
jgi:hypothetical protein